MGTTASVTPVLDGSLDLPHNINCSNPSSAPAGLLYVDGCGSWRVPARHFENAQPGIAFGLGQARWDAWILVGANGFDGGAIDLLEWQEPAPSDAPPSALYESGFQRVGVLVPDLDVAIANTSAHGGTVWSEPTTHQVPGGEQMRLVFVSDPDGTAVELVEGRSSRLSFVAVTCRDLERSVGFYASLGFHELARFPTTQKSGSHLHVDGPVSMIEVLMGAPRRGEVHLMLVGFEQPDVRLGGPSRQRARHVARRAAAP